MSQEIPKSGRTDLLITQDTARHALNRVLEDAELSKLHEIYVGLLETGLTQSERLEVLPGVRTLLNTLKSLKSVLLGLQTGNIESAAWTKLRAAEIDPFFRFGGFCVNSADRVDVLHQALESLRVLHRTCKSSDVYVIGDTPADVQAAKIVGANSIAVATGCFSREQLELAKPSYVMDNLTQMDEFIAAVGIEL